MNSESKKVRQIFLDAVERFPPDQWDAYLEQACGDDAQLRDQVKILLEAHIGEGSLLDGPAIAPGPTLDQPPLEKPGTQIGPYKLLQEIGQGGMGVVYMAEQKEPVERRMALKIIKPGMDTRQVIARFEAERQALAMMDHPNIAKVLDAGATESGRPYFVMELVNGIPVTQFCDEQHLTARERLELFVPICQAVQHAHQKGIIHRDIKPSNILVALYDARPVPKVIDFGVAKATGGRLTEKTMFTGLGQIVGTIEYMSPEQAQRNQLDIDTRSDVYSLGVLLYELLTGDTPFDKLRLRSAAVDELLRIIREEEPPTPSTKISSSDTLPSVAANRKIEPAKLSALVRGELDWIVMKALEKDRTRRYETANKFAEDIQHYLNDEPVVACPPSAAYKFRKFTRRNKAAFATTTAIALSLIIGTGVAVWYAARATQQRNRAIAAEGKAETEAEKARTEAAIARAVNDFLQKDLLDFTDMTKPFQDGVLPDPNVKMRTILDRAADKIDGEFPSQPVVEAQVRSAIGMSYVALGEYVKAEDQHRRALGLCERFLGLEHPYTVASMSKLAVVYYLEGRYDEAEKLLHQALEIGRRTLGNEHQDTLKIMYALAVVYLKQNRGEEAANILYQRLECQRISLGNKHPDVLTTSSDLALSYRKLGRFDEAESLLRETLEIQRDTLGDEHPDTLTTMFNLAAVRCDQHQYDEAEDLARQTLAIYRRTLGDEHPTSLAGMHNLAVIYLKERRYDESETYFRQALELRRRALGDEHPDTLATIESLAVVCVNQGYGLSNQGKLEGAIAYYREAMELNPKLKTAYEGLGYILAAQDKLVEATPYFRKMVELDPESPMAHYNLGLALLKQDKPDDALACFNRAVQLDSQAANAHEQKGCALLQIGRKDDAVTAFRQAVKLSPDDATILSDIAWHLVTDPDLAVRAAAEAVTYAQKAVDLEPDIANRWSNLGVARFRAGQWQAAVDDFQKADALIGGSGDCEHRFFLAMTHWKLTNQARAHEAYAQALNWLNEENRDEEQYRFRDEAEQLMGISAADRPVIVLASLTRAVETEPENAQALNALARFLAATDAPQLRNAKEAVELARQAVASDPASRAFLDTLSIAAYRAGDWKTALESRETSRRAGGGGPYDWLWLSMIHFQLQNETEARQWYDKAVQQIEKEPPPTLLKGTIEALRREAETTLRVADEKLPDTDQKPEQETNSTSQAQQDPEQD